MLSQTYSAGEYMPLLKSGKFPTLTESDLRLVLDRFLLTKVGAFPDCYERLATNFLDTKNEISALVTCERAVSIFYGWGHPVNFHAKLMSKLPGIFMTQKYRTWKRECNISTYLTVYMR